MPTQMLAIMAHSFLPWWRMHRLKRIFQHLGYPMATSKTLSLTCQIKCRCSHIPCNEAWVGSDIQRVCARLLLSGRDATEPCLEVKFLESSPWLKYLPWVLMSLYKPLLGPWVASLFPPKKMVRTFGELQRCCGVTARRLEVSPLSKFGARGRIRHVEVRELVRKTFGLAPQTTLVVHTSVTFYCRRKALVCDVHRSRLFRVVYRRWKYVRFMLP